MPMTAGKAACRTGSVAFRSAGASQDSLTLALDALLRAFGTEVDLKTLAGLLSTGHANVVEAARRFGVELRDLHPPEAAPLPTPPEFEQHFQDSYLPFIRAALTRDEPVLAWMGWPPPDECEWGVITGIDPATNRCIGRTRSSPKADVAMIGPAVQVYTVVE